MSKSKRIIIELLFLHIVYTMYYVFHFYFNLFKYVDYSGSLKYIYLLIFIFSGPSAFLAWGNDAIFIYILFSILFFTFIICAVRFQKRRIYFAFAAGTIWIISPFISYGASV